jgi:uncharacterized membrane protein YfcA
MTTCTLFGWISVALIGLAAGTLSGSLGVGSAIVLIPALVAILAIPQKTAQAMSLIVMTPMVLMAAIRYCLHPGIQIDRWTAAVLAVAAVAGANIGSSLAFALPADALRRAFAIFMIGAGLLLLRK